MGNQKSNIAKMIFTLAFLSSALMALTAGLPYYPTGNSYRARTERMMKPTPTQTIAELAIATPQLSTLLAAVQAADLVETLSGEGPFTVFAPTNEAFAEIPKDTLDTAGGESIEVTRDRYIKIKSSAGEAGVVAFDIMATNGVVHIVNSVF